jgi:hypothetical protein
MSLREDEVAVLVFHETGKMVVLFHREFVGLFLFLKEEFFQRLR